MLPIILAGVAIGASIVLASCSNDEGADNDSGVQDTETGSDLDTDADTDIDTDSDTDIDSGTDLDTDTDSDVDTDTETESASDTDTYPDTPFAPGVSLYSDAPCAFPASITHEASDDRLYATCGMPGSLWKSPPLGESGEWSEVAEVPGYPSNHIIMDDEYAVVAHSSPDGFTVVDRIGNTAVQTVSLADLTITDELDEELAFVPNFPAGLYYYAAGQDLFVATSNLDNIDYTDPSLTTFHAGTVLYFDYSGDGTFDTTNVRSIETTGVNPTGVASIDDNSFAVLSAAPYEPSVDEEAAIDIFSLPDLEREGTALGAITGQTSPVMPLTEGGIILIGVQKPGNKIMGVDSTTAEIILDREMPDVENFISNVCAYGDVAVISDFGAFGEGSAILFAHTQATGWTGIPITPVTTGSSGPAVIVGDTLYQTVTANDGMSGSIWQANLSGME